MVPPPNGGYPNPNTNSMFVNRNARPATGFSASRLPRKDQQPGERPAQGQGQQRAYSPLGSGGGGGTGGGQSPQQGGPPVGFPQQSPPRQGSSGSPVPYQHQPLPPPNANNGARRASGPLIGGGGNGPPPSRLANAPHNSLPTPSPFTGGLPPAPSAALKEKLSTLPVLLYKLHKSQEAIQADAEYFDLPLLPSDEADELAKRVKDARGKARAAREREWDAQRQNLVDVVVEALSEFAGRKIEELVARGELREVGSADAAATNRLRNELQTALTDKADLVAKLSRLEVDTSDRLAKMQEELEKRIEEVEERWKVEVEKLRKAGPPAAAGTGTVEQDDTVSKAEHAALAANFDALTAKFDRLAALVGEATPSPPTTASSGSPPASSSRVVAAKPSCAPAASTVLGKRPFSTSADEPSTTSASPPSASTSSSSSAAPPTLFARLSNVDARVTKVEASVAEHATKDERNLSAMKECAKEVRQMKESQAGSSPPQGSAEEGKMVVDISEEGKEEREKQRREVKGAVEGLEMLEKALSELKGEWTGKLEDVDNRVSTLSTDLGTLQKHPLLATPPPAPNATPTSLRTDLDSLTARLDTISASLSRLPSSAYLSLLSTLHNHIQSLSSSPFDTTDHILAQGLSERLKAWDKAVRDLAAQGERLAELELHEARIAKLERGVKAHKTKTDERFRSIKDLIEYLETSALSEFERVATGYAKLQESGLIPPDETLGIAAPQPPREEQQEPGTPPQPPQTPAQAQGQQNGRETAMQRVPVAAAGQARQLPLHLQQQQPAQQQAPPPVAAAAPPLAQAPSQQQVEANGFADGSDEEDELDEDSMLVAPEGEVEEDDPLTGGAGGGGVAGLNGFVAR